jgi:hypothetical protein
MNELLVGQKEIMQALRCGRKRFRNIRKYLPIHNSGGTLVAHRNELLAALKRVPARKRSQ